MKPPGRSNSTLMTSKTIGSPLRSPLTHQDSHLCLKFFSTHLQMKIDYISRLPKLQQESLVPLSQAIYSLIHCTYGEFSEQISSIISLIKQCLSQDTLDPHLNSFITQTLMVLHQMNRLFSRFFSPQISIPPSNSDTFDPDTFADDDYVICRICNNKVPRSLFSEHTDACAVSMKSEADLLSINDNLRNIQATIRKEDLNVLWPGEMELATNFLLPLLHVVQVI